MKLTYAMVAVVFMAGGMGLTPVAGAENPLGMTLTRQLPATYSPGGTVQVQLTLACTGDSSTLRALGIHETVPVGWTFASMDGTKPQIGPRVGDSGTLEFAWFSMPAFPCTFTYVLNVPANAQGSQNFTGQIEYREQGAALFSDDTVSTLEATVLLENAEALRDGFTQADQDANGALSFEEASVFVPGISQTQFNQLDADGDEAVTLAELNAYIEANTPGCGCNCSKAEAFSKEWFKRSLGDLFLAGLSLFILAASAKLGRRSS